MIKPKSFYEFVIELGEKGFIERDVALQITTEGIMTPNLEVAWYQNKICLLYNQIEKLKEQIHEHKT